MTKACVTLLLLLCASTVQAQTPIPVAGTEQLAWDQPADTLATAQAYSYIPLVDTTTPPSSPVPFVGVTCSGAPSPFVCRVRLPALTTGLHQLRIVTLMMVGGAALLSPPSAPLAVLMMAVPVAAQNLRLETGP